MAMEVDLPRECQLLLPQPPRHPHPTHGNGETSLRHAFPRKRRLICDGGGGGRGMQQGIRHAHGDMQEEPQQPCFYFLRSKECPRGKGNGSCRFLHAHTTTPHMALLTQIPAHRQAVRAITLPTNTHTLYTAGQDKMIRMWDCITGQCSKVIPMGSDVGCMISQSGWIFVGLPNEVKAWNLESNSMQCLPGPKGQVHALAIYNDMLMAGSQDGSILVWKHTSSTATFEPLASLLGHTAAVVTMEVADQRLYSGSIDKTIRVWDLNTGCHVQTLEGHTNVVMGLISWEKYLFSCSLDGTVKVWGVAENGALKAQYTHPSDVRPGHVLHGALSLCGFIDRQGNSILLCSYNDNVIRLFELPSFTEKGVLFSREETRTLHAGLDGLVFSGDGSGELTFWTWTSPTTTAVAAASATTSA